MSAVEMIISGKKKHLGDDFTVARVLPYPKRRHVGPFVFFDEMGPATFKPGTGIDVRPHPHIGLATVTYLFEGELDHADTLGVQKTIYPGAVNLMTAGKGIAHSERTGPKARADGHTIHGIQVWIALPTEKEEIEPDFEHTPADKLPEFELGGATLRLILGSAFGHTSPVKVHSPIVYAHAEMPAGSAFDLPENSGDLAAYVVSGSIEAAGEPVGAGYMVVFNPGEAATLRARADSRVMLLGGADLGPRVMEWNFVSTTQERIEKAKADWRASIAGNWADTPFSMPPGEDEYIPLPGDPDPGQK